MSSIPLLGNWFDCGWLCGSTENVVDEPALNMKARFLNNVWSALEYEEGSSLDDGIECFDGRSLKGRRGDKDSNEYEYDEDESHDDDNNQEGDSHTSTSSIQSCQEPQEHTSNMPVLRQLPSFGSTLGSNSMQRSAGSGLSFYPTIRNSTPPKRTSSLESATRLARLSMIKPLFGSNKKNTEPHDDESSTMESKTGINKPTVQDPTNAFIFLRQ